ncbi:MAG: hypothetical protein EXS31_02745 [Pedosphaera sp.]|nr:hypothetical protein [Pedosphaera sp.]
MPIRPSEIEDKLETAINAWSQIAPEATFARMTLPQFEQALQPSLDTRSRIVELERQLTIARIERDNADKDSLQTLLNVVNSVKGDPEYGDNSHLNAALGYILKMERKSGLTRKTSAVTFPAIEESPTAKAA